MKNQIPIQIGERSVQNNFWTERKRSLVVIGTALLIIISVSAAVTIYLLLPDRAVSAQHALDADREERDRATPPVRVEGVSGPPGGPASLASPSVIDLDGVTLDRSNVQNFVPDGVPLGQLMTHSHEPKFSSGYSEGSLYYKLTGQNYTPVQISSITARILERNRPPSGTIVPFFPQGATEALTMGFDLDSSDVVEAKALDEFGLFTELDYLKTHAVTLALNETLAFEIEVRARECDCKFVVDVGFADGRSLTIDDGGKPFRFVTFASSYERAYVPMYDMVDSSSAPKAKLRRCQYLDECQLRYQQVYTK
ncbi:hypothetical protein ACW9HC_15715 [Nocardia gipuzkoensis]